MVSFSGSAEAKHGYRKRIFHGIINENKQAKKTNSRLRKCRYHTTTPLTEQRQGTQRPSRPSAQKGNTGLPANEWLASPLVLSVLYTCLTLNATFVVMKNKIHIKKKKSPTWPAFHKLEVYSWEEERKRVMNRFKILLITCKFTKRVFSTT